jgi:signal transduction histidine kinase
MNKIRPTQSADWVSVTARWVFLVVVGLWLALGIGFTLPVIILLILVALGNITFTAAGVTGFDLRWYRVFAVIFDALVAYLLFYFTGSMGADMGWVGVLPLITAALYFHWLGMFALLVINLGVQGAIAWRIVPLETVVAFLGMLFPLYLLVGLSVAYASRRWLSSRGRARKGGRRSRRSPADNAEGESRRSIYDLISEMTASLSYQRVLDTALSLSNSTLDELGASVEDMVSMVLFFTQEGGNITRLEVVSSRLLLPADKHLKLRGVSGLIGHAIEEGQASVSKNLSTDPELNQFVSLRDCRSAYCIPLRSGLDAYGVMLFSHPDSNFFSDDRREILDIIGKQFVIAIQNARLYQDLELEKERMMSIQEDARKKMARDLHDGPTQSIAAIAMRVNFARRLMDRDPKSAAEELYKIEELARRTTKEIRHMLFTLRPLVLESQGLIAALESMAGKMKDTYDQNVLIRIDPKVVEALEPGKQAVVFYLAEEAVNNARKHAKAGHIWVVLRMVREGLSLLEIRDDGVGFDVSCVEDAYEERGSLGMVNMRERSELINGVLHIDSEPGRGTRVRVAIPLTVEAAERLQRGA